MLLGGENSGGGNFARLSPCVYPLSSSSSSFSSSASSPCVHLVATAADDTNNNRRRSSYSTSNDSRSSTKPERAKRWGTEAAAVAAVGAVGAGGKPGGGNRLRGFCSASSSPPPKQYLRYIHRAKPPEAEAMPEGGPSQPGDSSPGSSLSVRIKKYSSNQDRGC